MKKSTKIVLGSLLVLGLIGGCTEDTEPTEATETVDTTTPQEEVDELQQQLDEEENEPTVQEMFIEKGVSEEKANEMFSTLQEIAGNDNFIIELDENNITDGSGRFTASIMQGDGWLDEGITINCTVFEGEIRLVNSGDLQLYDKENGGLLLSYAETILTTEESANFRMIAEDVMTGMAQNPSTVDFVSLFTTQNEEWRRGEVVTVQGVMSCLNGFGMELKYLYQVQLNYYTGELIDVAYEQTR